MSSEMDAATRDQWYVIESSAGLVAGHARRTRLLGTPILGERDASGGLSVVELDAAAVGGFADAVPGRYVAVSVSDTGTGIEEAIIKEIFEPFFTTKEVGQGTGLGLSMVYGLVQQSKGVLTVDSEVDAGTTFTIHLPLVEEATAAPVEDTPTEDAVDASAA